MESIGSPVQKLEDAEMSNYMDVQAVSAIQPVTNACWAFGNAVHLLSLISSQQAKTPTGVALTETYYKDIQCSLDNLTSPDLLGCVKDLREAFAFTMEGRTNAAKQKFTAARIEVEDLITASNDINLQIEAARVVTVCALYEHSGDLSQGNPEVTKVLMQLHNQVSIRNMFGICIGSNIVNRVLARFRRDKKAKPMRHLCIMNFILSDYFLSHGHITDFDKWPGVALSSKRTVQPAAFTLRMTEVKYGHREEQDGNSPIHLLASENSIITYGKHRYSIEAWCPNTLKQVATFVDSFTQSTSLATCRGTVLYVAKSESYSPAPNLTISAFNTLTKKPINIFFMVEGQCVHLVCGEDENAIMVITNDGVVHRTGAGTFDHVARVMSFDMETQLCSENSAATSSRLLYSQDGAIKVYDIASGNHIMDVTTDCWKYPVTIANYICSFQVLPNGVIKAVETRRVDNMHLIFTYKLNERTSNDAPLIACDVSDNLLLLMVERVVSVWDLVSGTELTSLVFDIPGMLKGCRPCSACFYQKKYIIVATLGGSLFRFAILE